MEMIDRYTLSGKDLEYLHYVDDHRAEVRAAWNVFKELPMTNGLLADDFLYSNVAVLIESHDMSKYSNVEFHGYRQWFFPRDGENKSKDFFLSAWNMHQKRNPHHWEYWVMPTRVLTILEMSMEFLIEMMMDWVAMSLKFNNRPSEWYEKNQDSMFLGDSTRYEIVRWMGVLDGVWEKLKE